MLLQGYRRTNSTIYIKVNGNVYEVRKYLHVALIFGISAYALKYFIFIYLMDPCAK